MLGTSPNCIRKLERAVAPFLFPATGLGYVPARTSFRIHFGDLYAAVREWYNLYVVHSLHAAHLSLKFWGAQKGVEFQFEFFPLTFSCFHAIKQVLLDPLRSISK